MRPKVAYTLGEGLVNMGFLDSLRERFGRKDPYDELYYDDLDDDYYDDEDGAPRTLLGNTPRPRVESVSVYTRSGYLVDTNSADEDLAAPSPNERNVRVRDTSDWTDSRLDYSPKESSHHAIPSTSVRPGDNRATQGGSTRTYSGRLPSYVLRPSNFEDVQTVVRRVSTNQPVVLSMRATNLEIAKRIVDFSLGFACGVGGSVRELDERVFVVLPAGVELSRGDLDKLAKDGIIKQNVEEDESR